MQESSSKLAATCCFLLILALLFSTSLWQCLQRCTLPDEDVDLLNGEITGQWEDAYDETSPFKDPITAVWGYLRYTLFRTGSTGAVIGKDGWLFTIQEFITPSEFSANIEANLHSIREFRDQLGARDITLVIALIPAKARIYPEHLHAPLPDIRRSLYERVIASLPPELVIDNRKALQSQKRDSPVFFRTDSHWTPAGARAVAQNIATHLRHYYPDLAAGFTTRFRSHSVGNETYYGDLTSFIPGRFLPPEERERWETVPLRNDNLFGAMEIPVALVGTSYTANENWNFSGFLQAALHTDILIHATENTGPVLPMQAFLQDADPASGGIKLVIWEFPERYFYLAPGEAP